MEKTQIIKALEKAKENSQKRNFRQTYDLIINLKGMDMKKADYQIDAFISLPHPRGKKTKVCALIGPELEASAKNSCDKHILADEFQNLQKKEIKKLAEDFDFFVAQANIMAKIATSFGRIFGPRGKMPNPKAGCVVPPNANLLPLYEKLQKTIRVSSKTAPIIQCSIGAEDSAPEHLADNALTIYNSILHLLPNEKNNIKDVLVKLTMGKPARIEDAKQELKKKRKSK